MNKVDAAVKEVFGPLNPREDVTFEELSQLVVEVRKKVEGSTEEERRYVPYPIVLGVLTRFLERTNGFHSYFHRGTKKPSFSTNLA